MRWARTLLSRLFLARTSKASARKRPVSKRARLAVESLETRIVPASLQVSLSPHSIVEAPGPASTAVGTVTRVNTDNTQPLTVQLSSSLALFWRQERPFFLGFLRPGGFF
jgi:hypothetical protein